MKRYLFWGAISFLLIFVCVCGALLYKYADVNLKEPVPAELQISQNNKEQNLTTGPTSWVGEMANLAPKKYALASNEIYIEFKDESKAVVKIAYQLVIDKNDIYSMFCLTQTLKNIPVDFSVVKENSQNLIYINTRDNGVLDRVINELKAYDIRSTFKEIKL